MSADRASIFLLDRGSNELWSRVALGIGDRVIRIPSDRGIVGHVVTTGALCNVADPYADPRFNPAIDRETGYRTRSILCAPMRGSNGAVIGALQVLNKTGAGPFTAEDERLATALAAQCAQAIGRMQPASGDSERRPVHAEPKAAMAKLLFADGDSVAGCSVAELLAGDFQVVRARCGQEALSLVQGERPDLFLLDAQVAPDGLEICRALRASPAGRDLPIIIIAGSWWPEDAAYAFDAGASDYIVRPFSPAQLRAKAHTWLLRTSRRDT